MNINKKAVLAKMKKLNILTQTELALRLDMSKSQLSQMLSNDFSPIKTNVIKLMNLLELDPNAMFTDSKGDELMSFENYTLMDYVESIDEINTSKFVSRFDYKLDKYTDLRGTIPKKEYSVLETFAGAGGLSLGLEKAGLNAQAVIEIDPQACKTLRKNRPSWNVIEDDINAVAKKIHTYPWIKKAENLDVLSGGYPCQSFSYAGLRQGLDDIRGTLFYPFSQLLRELNPRMFIAENVKGLVNHDDGKTLSTMIKVFEDAGYHVIWNILNAWDYNVAQKRERIVIIGIRNDVFSKQIIPFSFPKPYSYKPVLKDVLINVPLSEGASYPKGKVEVLKMVPPGGCWVDLPQEVAEKYMGASYKSGGGKRGMARRISWDEPSLTLTTSPAQKQTERCHPDETRPFTIREYARIQSFPDDWEFMGSIGSQYKQIGNAVPVNLAEAIGNAVVAYLNQFEITS